MAQFFRLPASPQNDLDLTMFLNGQQSPETTRIIHRTLAPEWHPQSGIQLTWPHAATDWAYMLREVTECYLRLAMEIATRETLLVVTPDAEGTRRLIEEKLPRRATANILYAECPTNDTWARDHGFLSVASSEGTELLDFRFNGWGGKFPAEADNGINARIKNLLHGKYTDCSDFVLEGGSIETDGQGTLLTSSQCLLNPNRNPRLDKAHIESLLAERLGVSHFLWLDHGHLAGDDTDAHIDTLARLCPNDTIAYTRCADAADEHHADLTAMEKQLLSFRTPQGKPYRLIPLPLPEAIFDESGERLPATYANYLVMNDTVLYPTYAQPAADEAAAKALREAFPDRDIVGTDCRALIRQHGSLHCATMQFPAGVMPQA